MAPLMFAGLIIVLLIGYPVAFSLSAVGLGFGFLAIQLGYFDFVLLQALPERIFGIASNQLLLSIPFFTFMGAILSAVDWPRISSTRWVNCSARYAEVLPIRSSSSGRCSERLQGP
jgi:hypothetical protein